MAKSQFKIPTSLDASYLDMEFNLKNHNGLGISRPVTAKTIVLSLFSLFLWFYSVFQTFMTSGGVFVIVVFTFFWFFLSFILIKPDQTKRLGLELIVPMIGYLFKSGRFMSVRMSDSVYNLKHLLNISDVDVEDGLIYFNDGAMGHVYHVVGSASILMFEQDKIMILDKVESFYRKLSADVEVLYDTVYEGHSVHDQINAVNQMISNLKSASPNLKKLLLEQKEVLEVAINNNQGLTSLHQYLIVRADNEGALRDFENLVLSDVENQGLMFRLIRRLGYDEATKYLKSVANGIS